jgi:dTDP-4-amino-4,6-dideoxygalactose transaminase
MGEDTGAPGWQVPLADVRLPPEAVEAAREVLEGGWLSMGPRVQAFESALGAYLGGVEVVACSSGTAALQLALAALGVGQGDEVVLPSLSFVAGANVVLELGAMPVFCDVRGEDDLTLDPASVERCVTDRTRAVVPMHYGGNPCDEGIVDVARRAGIAIVEDAAHAIGAHGGPGPCGTWGDAGCFSFFANKNLPLGEGGAVATSDGGLAGRMRTLRSHGMTTVTWERHTGHAADYDVTVPGYNLRLDEARAAMGAVLLAGLDAENDRRARLVARYRELLSEVPGVRMPFADRPEDERAAHHLVVVLLPTAADRERVRSRLAEERIQTSVHYPPTHAFAAHSGARADVPVTEALAPRLLTLPLYPHMDESQVELVVERLAAAMAPS